MVAFPLSEESRPGCINVDLELCPNLNFGDNFFRPLHRLSKSLATS